MCAIRSSKFITDFIFIDFCRLIPLYGVSENSRHTRHVQVDSINRIGRKPPSVQNLTYQLILSNELLEHKMYYNSETMSN